MTDENIMQEMEEGKIDEDTNSAEGREKLVEDGEIDSWEAGFSEGAEGRGSKNCCAECGKLLSDDETGTIEREVNGDIKWFCCEAHAENYAEKHKGDHLDRIEE